MLASRETKAVKRGTQKNCPSAIAVASINRLMISGPARSYIKVRDEVELVKPDTEMDEFDF